MVYEREEEVREDAEGEEAVEQKAPKVTVEHPDGTTEKLPGSYILAYLREPEVEGEQFSAESPLFMVQRGHPELFMELLTTVGEQCACQIIERMLGKVYAALEAEEKARKN